MSEYTHTPARAQRRFERVHEAVPACERHVDRRGVGRCAVRGEAHVHVVPAAAIVPTVPAAEVNVRRSHPLELIIIGLILFEIVQTTVMAMR